MILDLKESQELCDWLLQRGITLSEAACILGDLSGGDTLCLALLKVFNHRKERSYENKFANDWGNPITL